MTTPVVVEAVAVSWSTRLFSAVANFSYILFVVVGGVCDWVSANQDGTTSWFKKTRAIV